MHQNFRIGTFQRLKIYLVIQHAHQVPYRDGQSLSKLTQLNLVSSEDNRSSSQLVYINQALC